MKRALLCLAYTIGVRKGVVDERLNVAQIKGTVSRYCACTKL